MTVKWVCGSNEQYLPKMGAFLRSLDEHCPFELWYVAVGFETEPYKRVQAASIDRDLNLGAPPETECIQHGSFLQVIPGNDDDILIYSDGDMIMQRSLTQGEIDWLENFPDGMVSAGWNSGPGETLMDEATRIHPKITPWDTLKIWSTHILHLNCFNVGVLIARRSTWQRIYDAYIERWEKIGTTFEHQGRQQWLICYCFHLLQLQIHVMPYTFHTHAHYQIPDGVEEIGGLIYYKGEPVLLRHRI